ncbi:unnamed protein product [Rotaria magnacalcarata]|nr:unnamed protein product [Rotaria magnacalcarata]CAF1635055.1 unnamed protein product [Rotaria magnacalcarata]CAF4079780.1 unnamed protein product [Rotaria magnacalcarata]CAF4281493.1 unnamed protein product [Rotaria magnacalcarata]CAF4539908.1 unnamed protein product [Rotaria magnacalcarata]
MFSISVHGHQAQHIWLNVSMHVHESYDDGSANDDVAVIPLDTAVILDDNVSRLCIAPENLGQQELKTGESLIRFTTSKITICITRTFIMCAGFPPKAICFGDSGGPLVQLIAHSNRKTYWQQVSIMSGIVDCGHAKNCSDIYVRINYYHPWILDKIRISSELKFYLKTKKNRIYYF